MFLTVLLLDCSGDDNPPRAQGTVTFEFDHFWDESTLSNADFNEFKFTTENGDVISIERLRYLVSGFRFEKADGEVIAPDDYQLIDLTANSGLRFTLGSNIPNGEYSKVSFTFGFDNEDNANNYPDLNSANFNVPEMLGGGYHYMQFDGKFINTSNDEQGFNYHAIRAVDNPGPNPSFPQDTFFSVNLGSMTLTKNTTINVNANIAEWFKNPNLWDLNVLNAVLMPNASAQIMMYENGQNVFGLNVVTNE